MSGIYAREKKKKTLSKRKSPASFASTVLTFIQGLPFSRDLQPGRSSAAAPRQAPELHSLYAVTELGSKSANKTFS